MASFSHELLNSSQNPVRKTGRDRGLTPLESGCSHERPYNDIRGDGRCPSLYSIEGPDDVAAAVKRARDANQDHVLLLRNRDGNSIFVPLPIDGKTG